MLRAPSLLDIIPEAVVGNHPEDFANGTLLDEVTDLHTEREVPGPHGLHQEKVLVLRRLAQDPRLRRIDGESLLTEHILAGFQRKHHILEMVRVRRRDVHHVHVRIGHELFVRAVGSTRRGDARISNELLRPVLG
jgi:hypothetical protein